MAGAADGVSDQAANLAIKNPSMTMDPWASGIALLQTMAPLVGFSLPQWQRVQQGCAALLASHGAEMTRLGWTVEDAFGIHPEAGGNAVHCYGLGVMLGDSRVIEMTGRSARILLHSGVHQTFRRRTNVSAVPIWTVGNLA